MTSSRIKGGNSVLGRRKTAGVVALAAVSVFASLLFLPIVKAQRAEDTGIPNLDLAIYDFETEKELEKAVFDPVDGLINDHHVYVGLYDPACRDTFHENWFTWGAARNSDPRLVAVVRMERKNAPDLYKDAMKQWNVEEKEVTNCASILNFHMGSARDQYHVFPMDKDLEDDFMAWATERNRVEITFRNVGDKSVEVYFYTRRVAFEDNEPVSTLAPGQSATIFSFVSHVFYWKDMEAVRKGGSNNAIMGWLEVPKAGEIEVGHVTGHADQPNGQCEDKEQALHRFAYDVLYHERLVLNAVQPHRVPAITDTGFERHKLPSHVFKPIKDYWQKYQRLLQEEHKAGPSMNQLEVPTYLLVYPDSLKRELFKKVAPMLEEWSGRELKGTSCYGIRKYLNGSKLLHHCDTMSTHAISGIINVDQQVNEDWPLEIMDHDGNLHEVVMEPGDIVFYESARLLHGRPQALDGDYYANIFIHYTFDGWNPKPL